MSLSIIVCIKSVALEAPDGRVNRRLDAIALNPFDRPAIELALQLRDKHGGKVTVLSMGPESASLGLHEAMAMGANRAVLVCDRALAGSDTLATSTVLGSAIQKIGGFDLVLFGTRTSDSDTGQVGPQTGAFLDLPMVAGAYSVKYKEPLLSVENRVDQFVEKYEITLPGVLTVHPTAVQPRDPSLAGINAAFSSDGIEVIKLSDLGILEGKVGEPGSPTKVVSMKQIKKDRKCDFIKGPVEEQADELIRRLKDTGLIG